MDDREEVAKGPSGPRWIAFEPQESSGTIRAAQFVFEELAANIVQHSGAAQTGFGMAAADPVRKRIQIAFADAGIGFLASLGSNPEFSGRIEDDAEAIRLALDRRVSRAASGNIGMGLFLLSTFADRVQGDLSIATGDAMLVRRSGQGGRRVETFERTAGWRGAFLCLEARVPGW
jgi:anti-sigma regulatory factor (Ser/Thr protein kinase)